MEIDVRWTERMESTLHPNLYMTYHIPFPIFSRIAFKSAMLMTARSWFKVSSESILVSIFATRDMISPLSINAAKIVVTIHKERDTKRKVSAGENDTANHTEHDIQCVKSHIPIR